MQTLAPVTTAEPVPTTAVTTTIAPTTSTNPTTTTTTLPPSPLNGLGIPDDTLADRRVMAVKVDNHRNARPQSGIEKADAVFELLVEAGLSRFIALFHTSDSQYIGPIRSLRPTDATLVKPLGAPLQISGGQPWVRSLVAGLGVDFMGEVAQGSTFRIGSRSAPQNLYGDTVAMRDRADGRGYPDDPPQPMFVFGEPSSPTGIATRITLSWSSGNDVHWEWDGDRYLRFQGTNPHEWIDSEGEGGQIATDTLVVLVARRYTASPPSGQSGSSVPALDTVGNGTALLFYEGGVVEGTWARDAIDQPFALSTMEGDTMVVPPGVLWIAVFPSNRPVTWE